MKIAVLTGSPHKNGTTALLADRFIEGARAMRAPKDTKFTALMRLLETLIRALAVMPAV